MRISITAPLILSLTLTTLSAQAATTLYDGALGTSPATQGWIHPPLGGTETVGASFTTFDTSASGDSTRNGYARYTSALATPFLLDRTAGYTLRFDLRVTDETHANNDRAGVSLLALGNDSMGIELGFWKDHIWAQEYDPLNAAQQFVHGEDMAFSTTTGLTSYELSIFGSTYSLSANGTNILNGNLRDYSSSNASVGPLQIYKQQNFLFLGDDTTSARGGFDWSYASVGSVVVPEAGTCLLLLGALPLLFFLPLRPLRGNTTRGGQRFAGPCTAPQVTTMQRKVAAVRVGQKRKQ